MEDIFVRMFKVCSKASPCYRGFSLLLAFDHLAWGRENWSTFVLNILFVSCMRYFLSFASFSWCQRLDAACHCGIPWTFTERFADFIMQYFALESAFLRTGCGMRLYLFLIIAFLSTFLNKYNKQRH